MKFFILSAAVCIDGLPVFERLTTFANTIQSATESITITFTGFTGTLLEEVTKAAGKTDALLKQVNADIMSSINDAKNQWNEAVKLSIQNADAHLNYASQELSQILAVHGSCNAGTTGICAQIDAAFVEALAAARKIPEHVRTFIAKLGPTMERVKQLAIQAAGQADAKKKEFIDDILTELTASGDAAKAFYTEQEQIVLKNIITAIEKYVTPDTAPKALRQLAAGAGDEVCTKLETAKGDGNLGQATTYVSSALKKTGAADMKKCKENTASMLGAFFAVICVMLL